MAIGRRQRVVDREDQPPAVCKPTKVGSGLEAVAQGKTAAMDIEEDGGSLTDGALTAGL